MQSPKFVLSKRKVVEQYKIVENLADKVSYSSKTNQDVTRVLEKETDCMFSVHSANELEHVSDMSRVWFLAQAWDAGMIDDLIGRGVESFVVDNKYDLDVLIDYLLKADVKINLLLRIKLREMSIRTEKYYVFGMSSDVINKRIREIKANKKLNGIVSLGIHFHRKTQNMSEWRLVYEVSEMLDEDVLSMIDTVNIGGGLPSIYANTNDDVLPVIFDKIKDLRGWLNERGVAMIIEPGRFIAAPAVKLVTKIIGIYDNNIVVDASVYNTDMDALIVPVKLLIEGELSDGSGKDYTVKGSTPCSLDIFRYKVRLGNLRVGDEIVFLYAGAYNFMTDFCDLKKVWTEIVD